MTWQPPATSTGGSFTATISNVNSRVGIDSTDAGKAVLATQGMVESIVTNMQVQQGSPALNAPQPLSGLPAGSQGYVKWQ
jgi:hypothetical protein